MAKSNHSKKTRNSEGFEAELQDRVNQAIGKIAGKSNIIESAITYALENPGKRVRPLLVYLTADAIGLDLKKVDSLAVASEVIHTYSLVHDDLPCMDDDDLRRGQPTLHKKFSEAHAVLAGDAMQSLAMEIITNDKNISADQKVRIISFLAKTIGYEGMILGQAYDIEFEEKYVSKHEIIEMNQLKTGMLLEFCIRAPLLLIKSEDDNWKKLANSIGISFQLVDDLLDLQASQESLGKATRKDMELDKKNYPLTFGIDETQIEIKTYERIAIDSLTNLGLNNHPICNYVSELFRRQF
mgnify:CR=1 FL=1